MKSIKLLSQCLLGSCLMLMVGAVNAQDTKIKAKECRNIAINFFNQTPWGWQLTLYKNIIGAQMKDFNPSNQTELPKGSVGPATITATVKREPLGSFGTITRDDGGTWGCGGLLKVGLQDCGQDINVYAMYDEKTNYISCKTTVE